MFFLLRLWLPACRGKISIAFAIRSFDPSYGCAISRCSTQFTTCVRGKRVSIALTIRSFDLCLREGMESVSHKSSIALIIHSIDCTLEKWWAVPTLHICYLCTWSSPVVMAKETVMVAWRAGPDLLFVPHDSNNGTRFYKECGEHQEGKPPNQNTPRSLHNQCP